jgi:recombination protein RecT
MAPPTKLAKAPEWRRDIESMASEFMRTLGKQVPTDKFVRVIITAMQANPELAQCDRRSLKLACMRAAEDGLLPDGREGALVIYNTRGVKTVVWQPMVWGLVKKARASGEIANITAHVVYYHDDFHMLLGDEEKFEHTPNPDVDDDMMIEDNARGAYAIATMKDGTKTRAWRSRRHIMLAKEKSRAKAGMLWTDFWEEAWLKTVLRYLSKYLPKDSTEGFARAAERGDEQYDFDRAKDVTPARSRLERFVETQEVVAEANGEAPKEESQPEPEADPDTGELLLDDPDDTREPEEENRVAVTWAVGGKTIWLRPERALELWEEKSKEKTDVWIRAVLNRNPQLAQLLKETKS